MKDQYKNIEELFRDSFDGFEAEVSDKAWANIQKGMSKPSGTQFNAPDSTSVLGKLSTASWVVATATVIGIAAVVAIWMNSGNDSTKTLVQNESEMLQPKAKDTHPLDITDGKDKKSNLSDISETVSETSSDTKTHINGSETNADAKHNNDLFSPGNSGVEKPQNINETPSNPEIKKDVDKPNQETTKGNTPKERDNEFTSSKPVAEISVSLTNGYAPLSVDFSNYGSGGKVQWDFGDGGSSIESNPTYVYYKPGTYTVALKVENRIGQEVIETVTITVFSENTSRLYPIPNIITPNGDGNNDIFIIPGENLKSLLVSIYAAQGNKVYEITTPDGSWNGTDFSGVQLPNGVYYYTLDATGKDSVSYSRRGSITIKR